MVAKTKGALKSVPATKGAESESSSPQKRSRASSQSAGSSKSRPKSRSPARTKSPARPKSPARNKSPSRRSPGRSKSDISPPASSTPKVLNLQARSPVRRSPGRKSPTRAIRTNNSSVTETFSYEKRQQLQHPKNILPDTDTDDDVIEVETKAKPQAAVRGRTRKLEVLVERVDSGKSEGFASSTLKRVTRSSQNREIERVVHLKHFDAVAKKLGEFSDEDDPALRKKTESVERSTNFTQITEFGGSLGALFFILIVPTTIISLFVVCNAQQCSFTKAPNLNAFMRLSQYFHLTSFLGFLSFATILAILSALPFGGKRINGLPTKQGRFTYVMNGLFSCVVIIAIAGILEGVQKIRIADFVTQHLFHLLISSIIFGFLLSVYAYVRSFYVPLSSLNAHATGKSALYGFFMGRELNPRVFGILDLKMYIFRIGVIGPILLDLAFLYKDFKFVAKENQTISIADITNGINPTLLVLVVIHCIYFLDALAAEPSWVTSFEIQYEGFGYMSALGYPIYPFMVASVTAYVVNYKIALPTWQLVAITTIFFIGYILFRASNNQKDAFRKNPYDPSLSHLETIPTTKGKKLLCSGYWGFVRHPNYLGDILMNLSFAPFVLCVPPVITIYSIVLLLIHRSIRDNERCKQKYGAAWDRYCSKVKYVLIPKIY